MSLIIIIHILNVKNFIFLFSCFTVVRFHIMKRPKKICVLYLLLVYVTETKLAKYLAFNCLSC